MESKGALVISIDYEYAWGYADMRLSDADLARIRGEVAITERLLALFDKYDIPATWAIVGKLFEEGSDPAWSDTHGLIKKIAGAQAGHEVASHSYAHISYRDAGQEQAHADAKAAAETHARAGLPATSFIFPRNLEGNHEVLRAQGFRVYRGLTPRWYHAWPGPLRRVGHLLDSVLPLYKGVRPEAGQAGLTNLPDSALLFARNGVRRLIPVWLMSYMLVRGMRLAARRGAIFHLWFHPSNFSYDTNNQFFIFEAILADAARMRDASTFDVLTMRDASQIK